MLKKQSTIPVYIPFVILFVLSFTLYSCFYKLTDVSIPADVRTVRIQNIENRARIVNPQLSPRLSDRLRQKIVSQTRLTQTNRDSVDLDITGEIRDYSVTTAGVGDNNGNNGRNIAAVNRLTVTVHIVVNNNKTNLVKEYDATRTFDFSATRSIQQAENELLDDIVRNMTDEIFNRIFSEW